jgi:hypothetical protein
MTHAYDRQAASLADRPEAEIYSQREWRKFIRNRHNRSAAKKAWSGGGKAHGRAI